MPEPTNVAVAPSRDALVRTTPRTLAPFFWLATHLPACANACRPLGERIVPLVSPAVRRGTRLNATRIFGRRLDSAQQAAFTRAVIGNFYRFVTDVAQTCRCTRDELLSRIAHVEGESAYLAARAGRRGALLVTAHMGSFEAGLGALGRAEHRIHVVFKRDASGPFESMRSRLHRTLGVCEAPIDDGLAGWLSMRDALLSDEVVVMQADRALPGQRSEVVPFLHGHLRVPTGPVRLARMTGSPVIPVFTLRVPDGRFAVHLHPPISPGAGPLSGALPDPAVHAVARAIESMVAKYPEQWLALAPAFEEDATRV
jgi:KDO2-lipid IV(A) lauroyltransferase